MDRFHLMNVFVAVVDSGGLAGAGRKLGMSPPAVTRAMAELEASVGARLLARTTRVVRVTEAGARYVEDCRRILADVDMANESAAGVHAEPRGRITITAPMLFGRMHVTPIVTDYLRRHPHTSAACWFLDRMVNIVEEGADVAVRIGELPDSSLQAIAVGSVRRMVCASPAYLAQHGRPQQPQDLAAHTLISANAVTPMPEWRLVEKRTGEARNVRTAPRLLTTTNDSAIAAAVSGFGLTRVMSYQVADELQSGALQVVLEDFEPAPAPVHVVHREGRYASEKVRSFLDLAIARLRDNASLNPAGP